MEGPKNRRGGAHFSNTVLDVCSNRGNKREMGGTDFKWGAGHHCPPLATALIASKPAHKFVAGKSLTLSEQQYFVFDTASQSTNWQETLEIWGERLAWPPCLRLCTYPKHYFRGKSCVSFRKNHLFSFFSTFKLFSVVKWFDNHSICFK